MSILNTPDDPRHAVPNPIGQGLYRTVPLAAIILGFGIVAFYYGQLPAEIPMHFNARGEADSYGPKILLWLLPLINLAMFYGLEATTKSGFKWFNYPVKITEANAAEQHRIALQLIAVLRLVVNLLFSWIIYSLVSAALKGEGMLNMWVLGAFLVAIFGPIIYFTVEANKAK